FAYLLKPIDTEEYKKAIERSYLKNVQQQQMRLQLGKDYYDGNQEVHKIALSNENFTEIVDVNSIIYCRSEKGYTIFHLRDGNQVVVSKTLKKYEEILSPDIFIRCHQSYLININYIQK